jgi:hypothetical protein
LTAEDTHADDFGRAPWGLFWVDDRTEPQRPDACGYPLDRLFSERGIVTMRTGWTPDSLHVTLFSGRQGHTAHCHHDLNQATFYAIGERFIVDVGYWTNDPATGRELPGWPAEAHNLVSVDGVFQRGRHTNDWAEGRLIAFESDADYAYAVGDAREALGCVLRNERHILLSRRPDAPPYVIWIDDAQVDDTNVERDYRLFLHTIPGNRLRTEPGRATVEGRQAALDVHMAAAFAPQISLGAYGPFPRLEIAGRGTRGRLVLLLHPRRGGQPAARFRAALWEESVHVEVILGAVRHAYRFSTAPRSELTAGNARISVSRMA